MLVPSTCTGAFSGIRGVGDNQKKGNGEPMLFRLVVAGILCCGSLAHAQDTDVDELRRSEFGGMTQKEMSRRIFSKEQAMISRLAAIPFVTETYLQSLGHRQRKGLDRALDEGSERVIDDLYFLDRVDFGRAYGETPTEKVLFGERPRRRRFIEKSTGALEHIFPAGFLSMLFVDLYGFNADLYSLNYKGKENIAKTECLIFSVAPLIERDSGRFRGEIWIDSSSYGIVRAKGVFTGPYERWYRGSAKYFHFDSWRERVGDGWWVPSVTYFDERRTFRTDGNLDFHYRGYAVLWRQHDERSSSSSANKTEQAASTVDDMSSPTSRNAPAARLEADGLLAVPGPEEQRLNRLVEQIAPNGLPELHKIECRVLLTTPIEMFAVGDVIVVSRGLLNVIPDDSVLAVMLARQVAHIVLGHTRIADSFPHSLFDRQEKKDFAGFGIRWRPEQERATDLETAVLLKGSIFENAVANMSAFLSALESQSHRFPNLALPRFGAGVIREASKPASKEKPETGNLRFENRFRVSLNRVIIGPEEERESAEGRTMNQPVAANKSEQK
jgi:hypothetical protein